MRSILQWKGRKMNDRAVSPVIAVILMVAITVVLAATLWVWLSGFGSQASGSANSGSLSMMQTSVSGSTHTLQVSSASSGLKWTDLTFLAGGSVLAYNQSVPSGAFCVVQAGACVAVLPTGTVGAGSVLMVNVPAGSSVSITSGNSVIFTMTLN